MIINDQWATLMYLQQAGPVLDYSDRYLINRRGVVLNLNRYTRVEMVSTKGTHSSYKTFAVVDEGIQRRIRLHRALLSSFYPVPFDICELDACHIDGDTMNNKLDNLCWMSCKDNVRQAYNKGYLAVDPDTRLGTLLEPVKGVSNG